jgi:hypothetical protein
MNYKKEIIIRGIKIIDIGFITIIYIVLGIIIAKILDKFFGEFDEEKESKKSIFICILELTLHLWLIAIIIYIVRNITPLIPFPLNGIYGFNHLKVKELHSAEAFVFSILFFHNFYQSRIQHIFSKINL